VTLWVDSGGKVKGAATHPIHGRDAVARFALGTRRFLPEGARVELAAVNGQLALIFRAGDRAYLVLTIDLVPVGNALRATAAPSSDRDGSIEVEAQRIQTVRVMVNPEKLAHV
jgi:RNA polymerase sigma-70 factor, ECF subfamily